MTPPRLRTHIRGLVVAIDNAARRVSLIAGACLIAWAGRVPRREHSETEVCPLRGPHDCNRANHGDAHADGTHKMRCHFCGRANVPLRSGDAFHVPGYMCADSGSCANETRRVNAKGGVS